jgi:hypothetical protein
MLTSTRQNTHHSRLPRPGAIVIAPGLARHYGFTRRRPNARYSTAIPALRRFIVESFPLTDAADQRYSRGIHTCTIRALDTEERRRVAGHWLEEQD